MTLGFSDGAYNHASGTRDAFGALSDNLVAEGYPPMTSRSGDREPADQLKLWYERMTLTPGNRHVYGTKRWQGRTWYQIHPDAVGIPETSNHEKRRSNDLHAPYNADTAAARRAKVLARRHNITREGEGFRELWHWTFWGPLGTIGAPASAGGSTTAPPVSKEDDDMLALLIDGVHKCTLGPGVFSHMIKADNPDRVKDIIRGDDEYTKTTLTELPVLLARHGVDLHIWDVRDGKFVVLNPLDGSVREGNTWSAWNAIRSSVTAVKVTSEQTRVYVEQLAKAK